MTEAPHFDQRDQSVNTQTNIGQANQVIIQSSGFPQDLSVPHQLPSPPKDFMGREEEIRSLLDKFDRGATITGLRGMGGVGKTALALVLADQLKGSFSAGQIYLDMQGTSKNPLRPDKAMAHVIRSFLGPGFEVPEDQNGLCGFYRTVLSERKALILLDNAADHVQVEPLVPPAGSALLITSRNKFAMDGLKELDLNILPSKDACDFMQSICGRIGEHADELAKLCGCLPLALRNAAYVLKEKPNMGVASYIKRLNDARKRLDLVEASFDLSYQLLRPELQRLWCMLSVFPADFDLAGAAAVWQMENDAAEEALGELMRLSLVDFEPYTTGEGGRYRLHDLARDFSDLRLDESDRELSHERHAEHYISVLTNANELYKSGNGNIFTGLDFFDADRLNIFTGQAWAAKRFKANIKAAKLCSSYPREGFYLLGLRQHPKEQIHWLESALAAAQQLMDRKSEAAHLGRIGREYSHFGKYLVSIDYLEQAIALAREVGDPFVEGWALDNLGSVYRKKGDYETAIDYCQRHLRIAKEIGDKRGEGTALGNIGQAYYAKEDISSAINYYEQHLRIVLEEGNKRGERDAIGNLGNAYASLRDFKKAFSYYRKARAISEAMRDCRGIGDVLGNMGKAYFALREYDKSINYCKRALKASQMFGDREREAQALFTLGNVSSATGQRDEAISLAESALAIFEEIESPHAETVRKALEMWKS